MALTLIVPTLLWGLWTWTYRDGMGRLVAQGRTELALYVAHLEGLLAKYEPLPELLATNPRLIAFLHRPGGQESISALNQYLETINRISDAADTYLMDAAGLTIAASNWDSQRPFVGRNFSFRPYFRDAMGGELGRYFALGTASGQRGYYFAYPVRGGDGRMGDGPGYERAGPVADILGAVVIKIDIREAERRWSKPGQVFLVTDPDGVVFVSTDPGQRFRTLAPLAPETHQRVIDSRRYPGAALEPIGIEVVATLGGERLVRLPPRDAWPPGASHLWLTRTMPSAGWQVHLLAETGGALRDSTKLTALGAALIAMSFLLAALLVQRRKGREAHQALAEQARASLQRVNLALEERVAARTAELTRTNRRLRAEIDERLRAEQALREAQQALIQSAKLATLGQMSAGINHELNQPLAAIRTYAENGRLLLSASRTGEVAENLDQILALTERMAKIGAQLKLFARRTSGELTALPLAPVVEGAARIAAPALTRCGTTLTLEVPPGLRVRANDVLLQQVLVNLLGNACQALEGRPERRVEVSAHREGDQVVTLVQDTGPGIPETNLSLIFEPFYTTKTAGEGLGLGLAISGHIANAMGGSLSAEPCTAGARFRISLPAAEAEHV